MEREEGKEENIQLDNNSASGEVHEQNHEQHDEIQQPEVILRNLKPVLPEREKEERRRTLKRKINEEEAWNRISNDFSKILGDFQKNPNNPFPPSVFSPEKTHHEQPKTALSVPQSPTPPLSSSPSVSVEVAEEEKSQTTPLPQVEVEDVDKQTTKEEDDGDHSAEEPKLSPHHQDDNAQTEQLNNNNNAEEEESKPKLEENAETPLLGKVEEEYFEYYNEDAIIEPDGAKAIALWDYRGECSSDLSFNKGDIITVIQKYDNGWWEGELNGVIGDFPYNFVELITGGEDEEDMLNNSANMFYSELQGEVMFQTASLPASHASFKVTTTPQENTSDIKKRLTLSGSLGSSLNSRPTSTPNMTPKALPIKQGYLIKKGHKRRNWKVRYFVLESSKLSYYANPSDASVSKRMKGFIALQKNSLVKLAPEMKRSNCFAIYTDVKPFVIYIAAPTGDDMVNWMESISIARSTG